MEESRKSNIILENRRKLTLNGVLEVISYNDEKIALSTCLGNLDIKGKELKINKLDVQNGDVIITGVINAITYSIKEIGKNKKDSLIKRLFQ